MFIPLFKEEARIPVFTTEFIQHVTVGNDAWERLNNIGSFTFNAADIAFGMALSRVVEEDATEVTSHEGLAKGFENAYDYEL